MIVTSDVEGEAQPTRLIVHLRVVTPEIPVTVLVAKEGSVIVAVPLTTDHTPVPEVGVLPWRVVDVPHPIF